MSITRSRVVGLMDMHGKFGTCNYKNSDTNVFCFVDSQEFRVVPEEVPGRIGDFLYAKVPTHYKQAIWVEEFKGWVVRNSNDYQQIITVNHGVLRASHQFLELMRFFKSPGLIAVRSKLSSQDRFMLCKLSTLDVILWDFHYLKLAEDSEDLVVSKIDSDECSDVFKDIGKIKAIGSDNLYEIIDKSGKSRAIINPVKRLVFLPIAKSKQDSLEPTIKAVINFALSSANQRTY